MCYFFEVVNILRLQCARRQIVRDALRPDTDYPKGTTQKEAREVAQILERMEGWERAPAIVFQDCGKQRAWKKLENRGGTEF